MYKSGGILGVFFILWLGVAVLVTPSAAQAQTTTDQACDASDNCSICISSPVYTAADPTVAGNGIINSIFSAINSILSSASQTFYNSIVKSPTFWPTVTMLTILYIAVYGILIIFNITPFHAGEAMSRLFKIGIIYALLDPNVGWDFFLTYFGGAIIGGMNDLMIQFAVAGTNSSAQAVDIMQTGSVQLSNSAVSALIVPIGQVFSAKFFVAIVSLLSMGIFGWLLALFLTWALFEFSLMLVGAIATYIKSVVGLAFLFGIAPIFFALILFEKTREVFYGWLNQVIAFALTPVMLFAFIGFYAQLMGSTLTNMLYGPNSPDFCYVKWFSWAGGIFDMYWWRPTQVVTEGGNTVQLITPGDWGYKAPPIQMLDVLYFMMLCHLGKSFCKYIEQLAKDLSGGSGPGITRGTDVNNWLKNNLGGGRGLMERGSALLGGAVGGFAGGMAGMVDQAMGRGGAAGAGAGVGSKTTTIQRAALGTAPPRILDPQQKTTLRQMVQEYRSMSNLTGDRASQERQKLVNEIENLTGQPFNPENDNV